MASIGLSVQVAQAVSHRLKRWLGRGAYTLTGRFVTTREVWVDTDPSLPLDLDGAVRGRAPCGSRSCHRRCGSWSPTASSAADGGGVGGWCPVQDSNLRTRLRRPALYPLS